MTISRRFFFSCLIILTVPLVLGILLYVELIRTVRANTIEANFALLEQACEATEIRLSELERMSNELNMNSHIQKLMIGSGSMDGKGIYSLLESLDYMPDFSLENELIGSYYVYFRRNDFILTHCSAYLDTERMYDKFFAFEDMDFKQWKETILGAVCNKRFLPVCQVMTDWNYVLRIPYLQTLYLNETGEPAGQAVFLLNVDCITNLLSVHGDIQGSFVSIYDEHGQRITSSGDIPILPGPDKTDLNRSCFEAEYAGESYLISQVTSAEHGWTYLSGVPLDALMEQAASVRNILIIYALAALVLGIAISVSLAYRNSLPLKRLVNGLISSRDQLHQMYLKQKEIMRSAFLIRLLNQEFHNSEEIGQQLDHCGIDFGGECYAAVLVWLDADNELEGLDYARTVLADLVERNSDDEIRQLYTTLGPSEMLLLIGGNGRRPGDYRLLLKSYYQKLKDGYNISAVFYVGDVCHDLFQVQTSFAQAKQLYDFRIDTNSFLVEYSESKTGISLNNTEADLDKKLYALVYAGDSSAINLILDGICRDKLPVMSILNIRLMIGRLDSILVDICTSLPCCRQEEYERIRELLTEIIDCYPPEKAFELMKEAFAIFCRSIAKSKKSHNEELIKKIKEYLEQSYTDCNLCLSSAAVQFGITEQYLSNFFKEQTGENFSAYVEALRIDRASGLLKSGGGSMSVESIALQVGYNNVNSFRRAYKKIMGCSPSEFRSRQAGRPEGDEDE